MRLIKDISAPQLSSFGLDVEMNEQEKGLQAVLKQFCDDYLISYAGQLDAMPATEVIHNDSLFFKLHQRFSELGLSVDDLYLSSDKKAANRLKSIAYQELGKGDAGFAIGLMVAHYPYVMCKLLGRDDLAVQATGKIGCWIATQPSRGSDVGDIEGTEKADASRHQSGDMFAQIEGDEIILNGTSSDWVSLGPVAQVAIAYFVLQEENQTVFNDDGTAKSIGVFVPLDLQGVSKGEPLDKLGQRSLPQGAIVFSGTRVPIENMIAGPDEYRASMLTALCEGNHTMAAVFTGVSQRAYELALDYVHDRKQGGVPIVQHQAVHLRLYEAFQSIQSMRALTKQAFDYNALAESPHLLAATVAKVNVTENAVQVVSECMRFFGGKGLSKGYPMEKLLRDARASVTEDGDNHLLALKSGTYLSWAYLTKR